MCVSSRFACQVIYQDCTPVAWYFTSAKDGKIYRKKKSNVSGPAICEAMMHKHPEIDASAWFSGTMTFMSATAKKVRRCIYTVCSPVVPCSVYSLPSGT